MRLQSSQANCGSTALYNACCALGKGASLDACEAVCGVSATDGTSAAALIRGAKEIGLQLLYSIKESRDDTALLLLEKWIRRGAVPVCSVDEDSHWVAVIGMSGDRLLIADSDDPELVLAYTQGDFQTRWRYSKGTKHYYAAVFSVP